MVAKNTKKTLQESASKQSEHGTKRAPPKNPTPKPSKITPLRKLHKGKPSLVDEENEAQQELEPQGEGDDPALKLAKKLSLDAHQEKGEGEDDTSEKVVHESSSTTDSERTESRTEVAAPKGYKEQGEVASSTVTSGVSIHVRTQDQAGSDPEKAHESLVGPDPKPMQEDQTGSDSGKVHVSLAGPNPELMDEEFLATAYPKVHENLKLITDERVIEDNPESHSGSMSSMKNLEDTDNFRDQFLYDKPTEDEQEKSKVINDYDSTIPDPSHQTVTSPPLVIAPIIDFSSPKPHDSDASASKQHPTLTSTGWQITNTRDAIIDSSRHNSEPESGHSEHSSDDVSKQNEGHISDLKDTDNAYIPKVKAATWFKPIQEDERPATPEPEWTIPPNDFPEPENN
ncbi:hypothetical protein Tco_1497328 [Tanacetum coccineum]